MGCFSRRRGERQIDHPLHGGHSERWLAGFARLVARQPRNALRHEPRLPPPYHRLGFAGSPHDLVAEAQLEASERALTSASSIEDKEKAEEVRKKATALAIELSARLAAAKAEVQPKLDAVGPAREAAVAAEAARAAASEEARKTARDLEPISVFISR
jgi:hypothetical protein